LARARLNTQLELANTANMLPSSNNQNGGNEMVYKEFNTTIANLRTSTNLFYPFVVITDVGKEGMFKYDSTDTTSVDDNIHLIVDSAGKRWKRTSDIVNTKLPMVFSIASLQAFTQTTLCYYDGSVWEKLSGSSIASNGGSYAGTIINVSSSKYWSRIYDDYINVKWFGAKGDNSTDDYTSINNAINYCITVNSGNGVVLYFPGGTYLISQRITMPNRVGFQGANGRGTTIKPHSTFSDVYMFHAVNGTSSMFGSYLNDFFIDSRGKNLTSVVFSEAWQETGGMTRVVIVFDGTTLNGFEYSNGYGGAALLSLKQIEIFSESTNINATGIKINQVSSVGGFIVSVEDCTISGATGKILSSGIYMTNDALVLKTYHVEYVTSGVKLAGLSSLSVDTYTGSFNAVTNLIELLSGFSGIANLINVIPNGTTTYTLKDNVNSRHISILEENISNYSYQNSAFYAYVNADITGQIGDGTEIVIPFNTEVYDYKSEYNTTTGIFTAKKAGKYLFNIIVQVNLPFGTTGTTLYLNTPSGDYDVCRANISTLRDGNNEVTLTGTVVVDLAINDIARVAINVYGLALKTATIKASKSKFIGSYLYR
jgi:hypothetical protein